jgi:serine/threonine protein kinase
MNCYRCHSPIADDSRFCSSCGALMRDATLPTPTAEELDEAGARELELLIRAETAGEYEILREIGRGGMGVVYLAREKSLARDVAMKVLPPHLTYGKGVIGRFRREARTAAALEHPNIVPVYRIAPGGRLFWYTMKHLEGRSLAEVLLERNTLPLPATITILERIADALDYAHQRHVIHRDVKPGNVMLDPRGHVIVMDFGIAKEAAGGTLARSEAILGTPYYMSPEQCRGEPLTGASDQYSAGVMAYQMLCGRMPFDSKTVVDLLQKHCTEAPPPLKAMRPGLPQHVYEAVERAMAKHPHERFPSVTAFIRALLGPTSDSTLRLPRGWSLRRRVSSTFSRPGRPHRAWLVTGTVSALAATGLVAGALWWAQRSGSPASGTTQAVLRPPVPAEGSITLAEVPRGATVRIDGTPQNGIRFQLPAGLHELRLERAGWQPAVDTVLITAGDSLVHRFVDRPALPPVMSTLPGLTAGTERRAAPRSALLIVQTVGGWAKIYVDGALRREGTAYRDSVTAGEHRVRLERDGYLPVDTMVSVRTRATVLVRLNMRRAGS